MCLTLVLFSSAAACNCEISVNLELKPGFYEGYTFIIGNIHIYEMYMTIQKQSVGDNYLLVNDCRTARYI